MINLIYGSKGSGKTKRIIDAANEKAKSVKGNAVYITDKKEHSLDISNDIRFIDIMDYEICCESCLKGFIKGLLAGNSDIEMIYIDGLARFIKKDVEELKEFYTYLECVSAKYGVDFVLTVSVAELPKFMKKYV